MKTNDGQIERLKKIIYESVKSALNNFKLNENSDNAFRIEDYWDINSFSEEQLQSINTDLLIFVYGNNFGEPMQIDNGKLKVYEASAKEYTLPDDGIYTKQAIPSNAIIKCHSFNIFNNNLYK